MNNYDELHPDELLIATYSIVAGPNGYRTLCYDAISGQRIFTAAHSGEAIIGIIACHFYNSSLGLESTYSPVRDFISNPMEYDDGPNSAS